MFAISCLLVLAADPASPFRIQVVDAATGRGVPLVELRTVNDLLYVTDSAGMLAFGEPGLMNQSVFFFVSSHGYEFPKDGFGYRGTTLKVSPGGSAVVKVRRLNRAERLYRITGGGCYAESVLLGDRPPVEEPLLNAQVLGSDSVVNAVYRGRLHWFWGDTNRPRYPLGNFHVPGATSRLPPEGLDPDQGVNLTYFVDEQGFAKETARLPGNGPTWINGLVVLKDDGEEQLFAAYEKVRGVLEIYERGICRFDPQQQRFTGVTKYEPDVPLHPHGHPFQHDGYLYFGDPFPTTRVRATANSLLDLSQYEGFVWEEATREHVWKRGAKPLGQADEARLVKNGKLGPEAARFQLSDADGKRIVVHRGSVAWNDFLKKWVMVFVESGGTSVLGEVWCAAAESPTGPWRGAVKIATHERYSFYNPKQHPYFAQQGGRLIYFEGTYTKSFSGNSIGTPRYDYNQIMYRLDLSGLF